MLGVGRDTPLKSLGKGLEGMRLNYQFGPEEVQGIFEAISQNLGERELVINFFFEINSLTISNIRANLSQQ